MYYQYLIETRKALKKKITDRKIYLAFVIKCKRCFKWYDIVRNICELK
jgi:RNase P/RNase MRP subunit POP5